MACRPGLCTSYIAEALKGVHKDTDRYMLALYTRGANLNEYTETYTTKGEVTGPGYTAGGKALSGMRVVTEGSAVILSFNDAKWDMATIKGVVGGLVYNASKGGRAVGVLALNEETSSTNGPFIMIFPNTTASDGVFVID